jgi:hypothetical protein
MTNLDGNVLKLVFVRPLKQNIEGLFEYELFFSYTPEVVWGPFWDDNMPAQCNDVLPEKTTYDKIIKIETQYQMTVIQELNCFSMEHAIHGITALSWINIENLDEYPPSRATLIFGMKITTVSKILSEIDVELKEEDN